MTGGHVTVQVRFFAPFRYQLGVTDSAFEFSQQDGVTVRTLLLAIGDRWPRVALWGADAPESGEVRGASVVVNGRASTLESALSDGDEVSILGPISGG